MTTQFDLGKESELFMRMLKDREQVLSSLLGDLGSCGKNVDAFEKLTKLYHESPDSVSTEKALAACAKSLRHLNDVNRRLLLLLLVYVAGDNFTSDTGKVLVRMGRGQEALQEMLRQKMGGQ